MAVPSAPLAHRRRWRGAGAAVLVALAVLMWVALRASGAGEEPATAPPAPELSDGQTGDPAPDAPAPDAPDPDAPAPDAPGHDAARAAEEIARIAGQVAEVRGLPLRRRVDARFEPVGDLVTRIEELTAQEGGAAGSLDSWGRMLAGLGLIPEGTSVSAALRTLYDDTVVGIYVPGETRLYVSDTAPSVAAWTRWASAHEVVHALQDQHFPFSTLLDYPRGALDAELSGLALVEGDAVITQVTWAQRFLTSREMDEVGEQAGPVGAAPAATVPPYIVERFEFPYVAGPEFVSALLADGGQEAVDEALRHPPTTTAQILHPQRYLDGVEAIAVPMRARPGSGWRPERDDEFGEFDLRQMLGPLGRQRSRALAAGWAGGQVRSWVRGDAVAVAVGLVLDSADTARSLCDALPDWWRQGSGGTVRRAGLGESAGGWLGYRCQGSRVDLARAPDEAVAGALVGLRPDRGGGAGG